MCTLQCENSPWVPIDKLCGFTVFLGELRVFDGIAVPILVTLREGISDSLNPCLYFPSSERDLL